MEFLKLWSLWKVLLVSGGWILVCLLLTAAWVVFQFRGFRASSSGSSAIGGVSVGISELTLLIPFGPPIVLFVAWLIARWW